MVNLPYQPDDNSAYRFPVSVKGVVIQDDLVVLLKNERDEWELPGGKLELGESPEACLVREIQEELSIRTTVSTLIDTWVYSIARDTHVLIITFECLPSEPFSGLICSHEHKELKVFSVSELTSLNMPMAYKKSISRVIKQ